jgi:hypothetical protein
MAVGILYTSRLSRSAINSVNYYNEHQLGAGPRVATRCKSKEGAWRMPRSRRFSIVAAPAMGAVLLAATLSAPPALASPLPEGSVLPNYVIVSVGPNSSITVNSGPINGNVLLGDGNASNSSGGGNGQVIGHVDVSPPATGDFLAHIQIPPTVVTVASSVGTTAFADANTLSAAASALTATQTFSTIGGGQTIHGNGGLNVIDVNNINGAFTVAGGASDTFVFDVSGSFVSNQHMTLSGVLASNILFNLTGTSGNIFQTSGGDVLFGTFLATHGGDFQFSNLDLAGQLINTDGHIQFVSGSQVVPAPLIGHGLLVLLSIGGVLFGGRLVEKFKKR